jgi:hypothetical protein
MISTAFSIINLLPGNIRKAKEVLKIIEELVNAAGKFRARAVTAGVIAAMTASGPVIASLLRYPRWGLAATSRYARACYSA